jgi:hypothetical protein
MHNKTILIASCCTLLFATLASAERPRISEDRELKEIDLTGWDCLDRPAGTGKTPDAIERNRQKNRPAADLVGAHVEAMDTAAFLRSVADFDAQTKGKHRKDLSPAQRAELDQREKKLVALTGYLVLAYAGPPESTNCASTDFHDWHLEVFAQPADHPPRVGDPTPIICEITPRTQSAIYRVGIRLQSLAAFFRAPDLTYEPTGHAARKIRLTGNLLWDDEHNGAADIGVAIQSVGANKYHHPWRTTAWEIHPVAKIEVFDSIVPGPPESVLATPASTAQPTRALPSATPAEQFVTLTRPVTIKIPYGETVLPPGMRLPVVARSGETITVQYLGKPQTIPLDSTEPR